jgi:hypothetical protein
MDVLLCATSALAGASVRIRASGAAHCISRGLAVSAMTIGAGACVSGIDASANTLADPFSRASTPGEAAESATLVLANTSVEFEAMCANVRAVMRISYSCHILLLARFMPSPRIPCRIWRALIFAKKAAQKTGENVSRLKRDAEKAENQVNGRTNFSLINQAETTFIKYVTNRRKARPISF